ncbi:MAG TPA: ribonuclease HI family protein [Gemmataceae bacterium]|nr:ribonuclease HI family protein [Gemmataceae bacterium]
MAEPAVLSIHTDGASRGNPGEAAFAYVISRDSEPIVEEAECLGQMTNNQAEYTALVRALEHALELGAQHHVLVHSDSELMVKQMNGEYRVKNEELRDLYEQACALRKRFDGPVTIRHVRRAQNKRADQLCNEALDGKRCATPRSRGADATPLAGAVEIAKSAPPSNVRSEALKCLREAATAWSRGTGEPTPEQVWQRLTEVLERHGVKLP